MAWNNSDSAAVGAAPRADRSGKGGGERGASAALPKGIVRGLAAGLLAAILGGVAVWALCGRGAKSAAEGKEAAVKRQVVAPASRGHAERRTPLPEDGVKPATGAKPKEAEEGVVAAKATPAVEERKKPVHIRSSRYDVFNHFVEGELAHMVCMPVGEMVIGSREFDEDFMRDLTQALVDKIEISPDDSEETKYYKESVIALKKELKAMIKNGEDVAAALTQSRRELQKLGIYRNELEREINDFAAKGDEVSDDDVQDFVNAANLMLKEKGIEPFKFNRITRTIIQRNPFDQSQESASDSEQETTNE